ncbi:MAG: FAD-dependent oxidoreductase [Burkholderiaceae bacterium]
MSARVTRLSQTDTALTDATNVDVIVVGGGACGLVAALRLKHRGVDAIVLERDALPQGSTALSSGFIPACSTQVQKARGIEDSPALFAQDIQQKAHDTADPTLVAAYSNAIGPAIDWLSDAHAVPFELLDGFLYPGHSVLRMHAVPERTGEGLMNHLRVAAEKAGIDILCNAHVEALLASEDDAIGGVSLTRPDGSTETIACQQLLLACNGYGGNATLIEKWLPEMAGAAYGGHVGNDGSAVIWGEALGASLADMGAYQGHGSWATPHGVLVSWALMMRGGIQINSNGQRFQQETLGYSEAAVQVLNQPNQIAWNVFSQADLTFAREFPDFCDAEAAGALRLADSPATLARIIGCPTEAIAATLAAVDQSAQDQNPDAFGRQFEQALDGPFCAIKVTGALFHTQGGLLVDEHMRVCRPDGSTLPNCTAAGGAARGVSGNDVSGYLSGNGLLSAVAGGMLAADTIATNLQAA